MSWEFYNEKNVKTRKTHRCFFCNRIIPVGTISLYWSGMFEGSFQSSYACQWCEKHRDQFCGWDGEGIDFWDAIREDVFEKILDEIGIDVSLKFEGDDLIFMNRMTKEVIHKEHCPTVMAN